MGESKKEAQKVKKFDVEWWKSLTETDKGS